MAYNCPHCQKGIEDAVSKSEMLSKLKKRDGAIEAIEKQHEDTQKELRGAQRAHKAALQDLREELTNGHASALSMARMGFDEEGTAVAELLHGRLPEEGRPALTDWLQGQKDDPSTAHALLKTYFGDTATAQTEAAETKLAKKTPTATLPAPTGKAPTGTPPQWTPEGVRNWSPEEFAANAGALSQALGFDIMKAFGLSTPENNAA